MAQRRALLAEIIAAFLGGVFLLAAGMKLSSDRVVPNGVLVGAYAFAADIADQQIIPPLYSLLVARTVIGIEIALGLWLLTRVWMRASLRCAAGLILVFSMYLAISYMVGSRVTCSCMGKLGPDDLWMALGKNVLLFFLCLFSLHLMRLKSPVSGASAAAFS